MTKPRLSMWAVATAVAAALLTPITSAQATPNTATVLAGAALTLNQPSINGAQLGTFTISLHLRDPGGVQPSEGVSNANKLMLCPCVRLETVDSSGQALPWHQGQAMNIRAVSLTLASGSDQDGTWTGTTTVGAINHGHWQLTGVDAGSLHSNSGPNGLPSWQAVNGAAYGATAQVPGTTWPVLTINKPTTTVPYGSSYRLTGKAYYAFNRAPAAGIRVGVSDEDPDVWPLAPVYHYATTDKNGNWSVVADDPTDRIGVIFGAASVATSSSTHDVQYVSVLVISARPIHWVVGVTTGTSGTLHTIAVQLRPHLPTQLQLQRHDSDGWHVVATHVSASNGRFTFSTSRHGTWRVRALLGGQPINEGHVAPYTSASVTT
jgi:hypothetical protein